MAASGGHLLQQGRASVETRIKTLVNNDLKEICRAFNYQVSGTKAALQKRCVESEVYSRYCTRAIHTLGRGEVLTVSQFLTPLYAKVMQLLSAI